MRDMAREPVGKLLLFGATGDLAQRMLLPSLYGLHADGLLPEALTITGTARTEHSDASYRKFAHAALDEFLPPDRKDEKALKTFLARLQYQALDANDMGHYKDLAKKVGDVSAGLAIFLSTAPSLFEPVIDPDDVSGYVPGQSGHAPLRVRTGVGDDDVHDVHDTHGEDVHTDIHLDIHADIHADTYGETEAGAHAVVPSAVSSHAPSEAFTETIPVVRAEPESTEQESAAPSGSAGAPGWQVGPFGPGSALPLPDGSAPSPQFRVKARTSSMVFHTDASPFYERLEPQVWFRNADDARRAGFTSWERPRTA